MPESDPKWLFLGVSGSLEPQGCSCWCKMVPGHWYTVPHYATALPGSIVDFKIPNLAKIWPEMAQKCSFWVVFWGFLSPWGPRGVQVGPRCWQATGIMSHTMPQPSQVPLWALKSQIWSKIWPEMPLTCSIFAHYDTKNFLMTSKLLTEGFKQYQTMYYLKFPGAPQINCWADITDW